ncbi:MAG: hypothetical protein AB1758_29875 [Candidatus Eremiobacterota bacterium]
MRFRLAETVLDAERIIASRARRLAGLRSADAEVPNPREATHMDARLTNLSPELREAANRNPVLRQRLESTSEPLEMMPVDQQTLGLTMLPSVDPLLKGLSAGGFGMPPTAVSMQGTMVQGGEESKFSSRQDFVATANLVACLMAASLQTPTGSLAVHEMTRCQANMTDFSKTRWETTGQVAFPGQDAPGADNQHLTARGIPAKPGEVFNGFRTEGQIGDYEVAVESRMLPNGDAVHEGYLLLPGSDTQAGHVLPFRRTVKNPFAGSPPEPGTMPQHRPVQFEGEFGNLKETGQVIYEPGKPIRVERDVGDIHIEQQVAHEYAWSNSFGFGGPEQNGGSGQNHVRSDVGTLVERSQAGSHSGSAPRRGPNEPDQPEPDQPPLPDVPYPARPHDVQETERDTGGPIHPPQP